MRSATLRDSAASQRPTLRREIPADCLLQGQLHPNIKDRLERIRQLPHMGVSTLLAVERDESGKVWMVWDTIDGQPLVEAAINPRRLERDVAMLMREFALEVEALHAAGLVHGALGNDSVIVDREEKLHLTDLSPLLFHDPAIDELAVREILGEIVNRRNEQETGLGQLVARARNEQWPLRAIRLNLASLLESPDGTIEPAVAPRAAKRIRVGALLAAGVVALAGIAVSIVLYTRVQNATPKPLLPPIEQIP